MEKEGNKEEGRNAGRKQTVFYSREKMWSILFSQKIRKILVKNRQRIIQNKSNDKTKSKMIIIVLSRLKIKIHSMSV